MLPTFDDLGNLPPGIHRCSVAELVARFGSGSDEREAEISELWRFIEQPKADAIPFFADWRILPFDNLAADMFRSLRAQSVRIGSMDLKIASIVPVHDAT